MRSYEFVTIERLSQKGRSEERFVHIKDLATEDIDLRTVISVSCDCKDFSHISRNRVFQFLEKLLIITASPANFKKLSLRNSSYFFSELLPYLKESSIELLSVNKSTIKSNGELYSLMNGLPKYLKILNIVENRFVRTTEKDEEASSHDNDEKNEDAYSNYDAADFEPQEIERKMRNRDIRNSQVTSFCEIHGRKDDCAVLTSEGIHRVTRGLIDNLTITSFNSDLTSMDGVTSSISMFNKLFTISEKHGMQRLDDSQHGVGLYIVSRNKCIQKIIVDTIVTVILIFRSKKSHKLLRMVNHDITKRIARMLYASRNELIWKKVMQLG